MTDMEATKLSSEVEESMLTSSPPSLAGSANSRLSTSLGGGRPVRLGMKTVVRMSSSTFRWLPMEGTVRARCNHLPVSPCV